MAWIGAVVGAVVSAGSALYSAKRQEKREDTAVQRRAHDLSGAGFNPMLAMRPGEAAASAARVDSEAPSKGAERGSVTQASIKLMNAQKNKLDAETEMLYSSAGQAVAATGVAHATIGKIGAEIAEIQSRTDLQNFKAQIEGMEVRKLAAVLPDLIKSIRSEASRKAMGVPVFDHLNEVQREALDWLRKVGENLGEELYEETEGVGRVKESLKRVIEKLKKGEFR